MADGKRGRPTGWSADFLFWWAPASKCQVVTAEYDHYRCAFGRLDPHRQSDGISLYTAIVQSAPFAVSALLDGKEATSWHRVVKVDKLGEPYNPFEQPQLFLELANVGREIRELRAAVTQEAHILKWVKTYGPLGLWGGAPVPDVLGHGGPLMMSAMEPVEFFVAEAVRMAFLVDLYKVLASSDGVELREKFQVWFRWRKGKGGYEFRAEADPLYLVAGPPPVATVCPGSPSTPRELVLFGLQYLANTVSLYVCGGHLHSRHGVWPKGLELRLLECADESMEPMWEVRRGWSCTTLLTALYVQFLDLICEKGQTEICSQCGRWYAPGKAGGRFCSPKCRKEHHYLTKKKPALDMYRRGIPVSEIAATLGVDEESVRRWVGEVD